MSHHQPEPAGRISSACVTNQVARCCQGNSRLRTSGAQRSHLRQSALDLGAKLVGIHHAGTHVGRYGDAGFLRPISQAGKFSFGEPHRNNGAPLVQLAQLVQQLQLTPGRFDFHRTHRRIQRRHLAPKCAATGGGSGQDLLGEIGIGALPGVFPMRPSRRLDLALRFRVVGLVCRVVRTGPLRLCSSFWKRSRRHSSAASRNGDRRFYRVTGTGSGRRDWRGRDAEICRRLGMSDCGVDRCRAVWFAVSDCPGSCLRAVARRGGV